MVDWFLVLQDINFIRNLTGGTLDQKKCPHCGKEVKVIPFGSRYIAVCCNQIVYVGHEAPRSEETDNPQENADRGQHQ